MKQHIFFKLEICSYALSSVLHAVFLVAPVAKTVPSNRAVCRISEEPVRVNYQEVELIMMDRKRSLCQGLSGRQRKLTSFPLVPLPTLEPSKDTKPGAEYHDSKCIKAPKLSPWKDLGKGSIVGYWPRMLSKVQHDHAFQVRRTPTCYHVTQFCFALVLVWVMSWRSMCRLCGWQAPHELPFLVDDPVTIRS
jgi:hypothetical protein